MKTLVAVILKAATHASRSPYLLFVAALFTLAFWFLISSPAFAGVATNCQVCHNRNRTLTYLCDSIEYQRHLDHGDPATACGMSTTGRDLAREKQEK